MVHWGIAKTEAIISQKLVRAPFDGVLGVRHVEVGQFLTAGTQIVTLTDLATLYANFTVTEKDSAQLKAGQTARAVVAADHGGTFDGNLPSLYGQIPNIPGMFYNQGKLYSTLYGDSTMHTPWFSPDSGIDHERVLHVPS